MSTINNAADAPKILNPQLSSGRLEEPATSTLSAVALPAIIHSLVPGSANPLFHVSAQHAQGGRRNGQPAAINALNRQGVSVRYIHNPRPVVDHLANALRILAEAGLSTPENRTALNKTQYIENLANGFRILAEGDFLTQENFDDLIRNAQNAWGFAAALHGLKVAGLLTPANRAVLIQSEYRAGKLSSAFRILKEAGLMTQKNFDNLTQDLRYAENFVDESRELAKAGLLTPENFDNTQHIVNLVSGFSILTDGGRFVVVKDNLKALFTALIKNAEYARELATEFHSLREADIWRRDILTPLMMTPKNCDALIRNARHAKGLSRILQSLMRTDLGCGLNARVAQENFHALMTQANFDALIKNAKRAGWIAEGVRALSVAYILTQANFDKLLRGNGVHARIFVERMAETATPLTQNRFDETMGFIDWFDKIMNSVD